VSDKTSRRLFRHARSFEDTPETVIEEILDRLENEESNAHKGDAPELLDEEGLLPEGEYWLPILEILVESDGSLKGRDVINRLEDRLAPRLTQRDHEVLTMGETRWRNRARFARLRMKEKGLISSNSPRGIWEITDGGRRYLNERPPR
jgi:hypothetical protein